MRCPKCEGRGWYENPKYPNPASWSYAGEPSIDCRKCGKRGYIIGNVPDVVEFLKVLANNFEHDKERLREIKQCIEAIEK